MMTENIYPAPQFMKWLRKTWRRKEIDPRHLEKMAMKFAHAYKIDHIKLLDILLRHRYITPHGTNVYNVHYDG